MAEEGKDKRVRALVVSTRHEFQRHQDTMPDREKVRADFEEFLRGVIEERNIDLVAEEAGDDTAVWGNLRREDEAVGEFAVLFGGGKTVDSPVPTIARTIADEYGVKYADVDVGVRANEGDVESIKKRDKAMAEKILSVTEGAERLLVIVGEKHRAGTAQRLKDTGMSVECYSEQTEL